MRKMMATVSAALLTVLVCGTAAPAAAAGSSGQEAKPFSATYAEGTSSGSSSYDAVDDDLYIDGTLRVSGSGCFSTWVQKIRDFHIFPAEQVAYRCGAGSTDFSSVQQLSLSPTWNVDIRVCRGAQDQDCGQNQQL